jgi:hypothetical protein
LVVAARAAVLLVTLAVAVERAVIESSQAKHCYPEPATPSQWELVGHAEPTRAAPEITPFSTPSHPQAVVVGLEQGVLAAQAVVVVTEALAPLAPAIRQQQAPRKVIAALVTAAVAVVLVEPALAVAAVAAVLDVLRLLLEPAFCEAEAAAVRKLTAQAIPEARAKPAVATAAALPPPVRQIPAAEAAQVAVRELRPGKTVALVW